MSKSGDLDGHDIDGRYRLGAKLGEGGMGIVYRATQLSTSREVAFKVVKIDVGDDIRLERFKQEIEIISNLSHPNIVRVIDTGTLSDHELLYVVMDLVDGIALSDLLWHKHGEGQYFKCRVRVELALEVIYQLCAALTEPHRQGIIHRDIKPENILLSPSSDETVQLKVLDFGIARVLNSSKPSQRKKMTDSRIPFVGTPHYMAPEQVARSQYDTRTDLYAVGVVLFEMLSSHYPFDDENLLALLLQKTQQGAPSLGDVIPEASALLEDVVELTDALLALDQEARPPDAMQVRRAIEEIRDAHRLERVRIDAREFFSSRAERREELGLVDEEETLEPFKALYRRWLLYPSGKPLLPEAAAPQGALAAPSSPELLNLSSVSLKDINEGESEPSEPVEPLSDVLKAPKRNKLKAWNVDAGWTDSLHAEALGELGFEEFSSHLEEESDPVEDIITQIWRPRQGSPVTPLIGHAPHTPDFGATTLTPEPDEPALSHQAETIRERAVVHRGAGSELFSSTADTLPEAFSVKSPEIQSILKEAKSARQRPHQQSTPALDSGLHTFLPAADASPSHVARVALFDDEPGDDDPLQPEAGVERQLKAELDGAEEAIAPTARASTRALFAVVFGVLILALLFFALWLTLS